MIRCYGQKVIVLLDEYDTPLQEAYVHGYWNELSFLIRSLFNSTFKTNNYLYRAVLTGITRISTPKATLGKESIFSDLNNLEVVTATWKKYETSFGFTEGEADKALAAFDLSAQKTAVKKWYDGFCFGLRKDIYNPWSITKYPDTKKLDSYWGNTSSNSLADRLIRQGTADIKIAMEDLLAGKQLETIIDEEPVFDRLDD